MNGPTFTPHPCHTSVVFHSPVRIVPCVSLFGERAGTPMVTGTRMHCELTYVPPFVTDLPEGVVHIWRGVRRIPSVLSVSLPTGHVPRYLHVGGTPCLRRSLSLLEVGDFRRCFRKWVPQYLRQVKMVTTYRSTVSTYEACSFVVCVQRREPIPMPRRSTAVLPLHDSTK